MEKDLTISILLCESALKIRSQLLRQAFHIVPFPSGPVKSGSSRSAQGSAPAGPNLAPVNGGQQIDNRGLDRRAAHQRIDGLATKMGERCHSCSPSGSTSRISVFEYATALYVATLAQIQVFAPPAHDLGLTTTPSPNGPRRATVPAECIVAILHPTNFDGHG